MRFARTLLLAGIVLASLFVQLPVQHPAQLNAQEKYNLATERKQFVGQVAHLAHSSVNSTTTVLLSAEGRELNRDVEHRNVELTAEWKVLAIDEEAQPTKSQIIVDRLEETIGDAAEQLIEPGKTLLVTAAPDADSEAEALLDGQPVAAELRATLAELQVIRDGKDSTQDLDALFGTDVPRAVGEKWELPKENLAKFLDDLAKDIKFDLEKSRAVVAVEAIEKVNGVDCLRLLLDMQMGGIKMEVPAPMFRVVDIESSFKATALMPVDEALLSQMMEFRMYLDIEMMGIEGDVEGLLINMHTESRLSVRQTGKPVMRQWSDVTGKFRVTAKLIKQADGDAHLLREGGKTIVVPIARLSEADQAYLTAQTEIAAAANN